MPSEAPRYTPHQVNVRETSFDTGASEVAETLTGIGKMISDQGHEIVKSEAVERGTKKAGAYEFKRDENGFTIAPDEAPENQLLSRYENVQFNLDVKQAYLANLDTDITLGVAKLKADNPDDAIAFATSAKGWKKGLMKGVPPELRNAVSSTADKVIGQGQQEVYNGFVKKTKRENFAELEDAYGVNEQEYYRLMLSGNTVDSNDYLEGAMVNLQAELDGQHITPTAYENRKQTILHNGVMQYWRGAVKRDYDENGELSAKEIVNMLQDNPPKGVDVEKWASSSIPVLRSVISGRKSKDDLVDKQISDEALLEYSTDILENGDLAIIREKITNDERIQKGSQQQQIVSWLDKQIKFNTEKAILDEKNWSDRSKVNLANSKILMQSMSPEEEKIMDAYFRAGMLNLAILDQFPSMTPENKKEWAKVFAETEKLNEEGKNYVRKDLAIAEIATRVWPSDGQELILYAMQNGLERKDWQPLVSANRQKNEESQSFRKDDPAFAVTEDLIISFLKQGAFWDYSKSPNAQEKREGIQKYRDLLEKLPRDVQEHKENNPTIPFDYNKWDTDNLSGLYEKSFVEKLMGIKDRVFGTETAIDEAKRAFDQKEISDLLTASQTTPDEWRNDILKKVGTTMIGTDGKPFTVTREILIRGLRAKANAIENKTYTKVHPTEPIEEEIIEPLEAEAEVKEVDGKEYKVYSRQEIMDTIKNVSKEVGVPHDLMLTNIFTESGFDQFKVSPTGAKGIAQVIGKTAKAEGLAGDEFDAEKAIRWKANKLKSIKSNLVRNGIEPSDFNIYMSYQQGDAGFRAILREAEGGKKVSETIRKNMNVNDGGQFKETGKPMTAKEFLKFWKELYSRKSKQSVIEANKNA